MFNGKVKNRKISMAGKSKRNNRREVLAKAKADRNERENKRKRLKSSKIIQTWYRGVQARLYIATSQRLLLDTGLREAGVRYARLVQSGQRYVTDISALSQLITTYNVTTRHRFTKKKQFLKEDFARTCNLARLILVSCTSKISAENVCTVASEQPQVWLYKFHFLLRSILLNLQNVEYRITKQAVLPSQVLLFILNPKQWQKNAGKDKKGFIKKSHT